ncbi:hypothetical protein EOM57_04245 [Candidatus Saccharibacteria bacterium]|nr:hypothetical protein [Candidatus Saccharibacteria bacterium]
MNYYIDNIDIKTYGVYVSSSSGLISKPRPKRQSAMSWPGYNGEVVDLSVVVYEPRSIKLECFIKASNKEQFLAMAFTFLGLFDQPGTRRLMVDAGAAKPLVFEVYLDSAFDVEKAFDTAHNTGTFTLNLKEPEPIKRVLRYEVTDMAKVVNVTLTSAKLLNVYWGDGATTEDVSGTDKAISHTYTTNGLYYILITGSIDQITSLTTNAIVIWEKI